MVAQAKASKAALHVSALVQLGPWQVFEVSANDSAP